MIGVLAVASQVLVSHLGKQSLASEPASSDEFGKGAVGIGGQCL